MTDVQSRYNILRKSSAVVEMDREVFKISSIFFLCMLEHLDVFYFMMYEHAQSWTSS